jgi:hypothetical protein
VFVGSGGRLAPVVKREAEMKEEGKKAKKRKE